MPQVNRIDSNFTGLRYAEESSVPKTLPGSPVWWPLEPNSYNDFGGNVTTVARTPISDDRQNKKGVVTDLDAQGGFNTDVTYSNIQNIMQGFMFADFRRKPEAGGYGLDIFTSVAASDDSYNAASGLDIFDAGDLIFATGFTAPANNGMKVIATAAAGKITVGDGLVDEADPPSGAKLVKVGVQGDTGDIDVDASGSLPRLTSSTTDFSAIGLIPGEWIFVGGDIAGTQFGTAANNGWKRVASVSASEIVLDKSSTTMVTEANTTSTVQIFVGRLLINETGTNIKRRTYHLERTLGVPNTDNPNDAQAEYLKGAVPNEMVINFTTAEKLTIDMSFIAMDHTPVAAGSIYSGARPALEQTDAFNSSNDISRIKMNVVDGADANPTDLFAYVTEAAITVANNVTANKVIGTIGAADMTAGNFNVTGTMTAYFANTEALLAVRNNASVTVDFILAKDNKGIVMDFPLITLGEGRAQVEQDQPITLPLGFNAAKGPQGFTMSWGFFDYLPDAADV